MKDGYGVCPVCNGTKLIELTAEEREQWWHKKKNRTHRDCDNCGAQYMYGSSKGEVRLNAQGEPCTHKYQSSNAGRCLTNYDCVHCGDHYQIDSGD